MNQKCVVLGGSGFLGRTIVDELTSRGDLVISADRTAVDTVQPGVSYQYCDLTKPDTIRAAINGADEVYLIAGVLGTSELEKDVANAVMVNVLGSVNVLNACLAEKVPKVFYPSKPSPWLNTYGPGQHVYPVRKVIPTFCLMARLGLPLRIFGTGLNVSDQIYSKDIGRIVVQAVRQGMSDRLYDLGTGVGRTTIEIAKAVNTVAGRNSGDYVFEPMRPGELEGTKLVADIDPLTIAFAKRGRALYFSDWMDTLSKTYRYYSTLPMTEVKKAQEMWG
jgi:UDP-glucose 4-epimerase